jgi:hypothetical protein
MTAEVVNMIEANYKSMSYNQLILERKRVSESTTMAPKEMRERVEILNREIAIKYKKYNGI